LTVEDPQCVFCKITRGGIPADLVYEDANSVAFLDSHPLFPGHVLLCPREHYQTLIDLPLTLTGPLFAATQLLARAVEAAVGAEGTFVAINNRVSQTVPHLHIHVVPRKRRDGLRGFFWPRQQYRDDTAREEVRNAIQREIQKLSHSVQAPSPP
jgi:histidine triad (HIT) family protein